MVNSFRVLIDHLVIFFCDVPVLLFCIVFFRLCFLLSVCGSLSILIANPFLGVYVDFLLICDLFFSLFNDFHLLAVFNFTAIQFITF